MSKLDDVIANLNKKFKTDIITKDRNKATFTTKDIIPFSSPSLSYLFFGGFKAHTLWEFSGAYSSGKTVLSMNIAGQFQKYYKKKWENEINEIESCTSPTKQQKERLIYLRDRGYKKIAWFDIEHSLNYVWASKNGLDVDDIIYIKPQAESAEELLDASLSLVESDSICLVVIDSLAALTSGAALTKSLDEKTYCGIAGPMTTWTSKILPMLNKFDCSVICINQQRDTLNSMFPQTHTVGGRAFQYGCSVRLELRKGKAIDENCNEIPNKEETYYGQFIDIQVLKNKLSNPSRRMSRLTLTYDKGLYPICDTLFMALSLGLIKKAGAWFSIVNEETGEVLVHENGDTMKWQGQANVLKYLETHEEVYKEVYDKVIKLIEDD